MASLNALKTDDSLQASVQHQFGIYGDIMDVKVMRDPQGRPYAFVQYERIEDAQNALINGHHKVLDGRPVRVEQAKVNRTLFVSRFDRELKEEHLLNCFKEFGLVEELILLKSTTTGKSKGCCYVKFHYRDDAIKAFTGLRSQYHWASEWASNVSNAHSQVDPFSVFVGQLDPYQVTEQCLFDIFQEYGNIDYIQLINKTAQGGAFRPAFAFIKFTSTEAPEAAIEAQASVFIHLDK